MSHVWTVPPCVAPMSSRFNLRAKDWIHEPDTKREYNEALFTEVAGRYAFVTVEGVGGEPGIVEVIDLDTYERVGRAEIGKQAGASKIHQQALRVDLGRLVLDATRIIVESDRPRLLGARRSVPTLRGAR